MSSTTSQAIPAQSFIDVSPPSGAPVIGAGAGVKRTRSTRRPSMRCTSIVPSSISMTSPTTGMRSSTLMM